MDVAKDEGTPPELIPEIQSRMEVRKKVKVVARKKGGKDIDWPKVKENVELLKKKCADFSKKVEGDDSTDSITVLTQRAKEIRMMWQDIRAQMNGKGH
jgi:histidyl-tRNA synthetase